MENGNGKLKKGPMETPCTQCAIPAQRVETALQEQDYGDMVAVTIVARIYTHIALNGQRKQCRENLPSPWLFTLCGMDEIQKVREVAAAMMGKFGDSKLLRFI